MAEPSPRTQAVPLTRIDPGSIVAPLPSPLTSLVGRDGEIAAVRTLLGRDGVRLVTLTGPGGVGKTRLAIATAADADAFPAGVIFVSLAPIRDPAQVGGAIAQALGVRYRGDRPIIERLGPVLAGRRALLVLDNAEHVADAAPLVAELLGAFPDLTVLSTSRVRLRISGEHVFVVPPLAMELPGDPPEAGEVALPAAARLFVERAAAVRAGYTPGSDEEGAITEICRRLDGLPLAIELAAVRIATAPAGVLLARLERRLPLLTGGARDLPARQQTMRDTVAWSYDLLAPAEQALFRWLSVFVGGFSLAAADHVAASLPVHGGDALAGLSALIDASLLREVDMGGGQSRYLMLETMREYGQELLNALDETPSAQDAHAAFFVGLNAWLDPNTIAPGGRFDDRLREIETEKPNLDAALTHLVATGDLTALLHLAGQCAVFWHHRGYLPEGRRWLEHALANTPPEPTFDRGMALAGLSLIRWTQVDIEGGIVPAEEALVIGKAIEHPRITALALHMLGLMENVRGQRELARAYLKEALLLWQQIGERSSEAMALMVISGSELGLRNITESRHRAEAALAIFRELGHSSGAAFSLMRLASIAEREGDDRLALVSFQDALRLWAGIGERWAIITALVGVVRIVAEHGQHHTAATLVGVIDARIEESGGGIFPGDREVHGRAVSIARDAMGESRFAECRATGRVLPMADVLAIALAVDIRHGRNSVGAPDGLSRREREVLRLLVEGRSNAEIADALYISVRTARSHVASILAKLDVPSRTAAATAAIRRNLV